MASMNISIKKDAYNFLSSLKSKTASFSDVILSFKKEKTALNFFGVLKEKNWTAAEDRIKNLRSSLFKRIPK